MEKNIFKRIFVHSKEKDIFDDMTQQGSIECDKESTALISITGKGIIQHGLWMHRYITLEKTIIEDRFE